MRGFSAEPLYREGPRVGRLGLGTVALGLDYGFGPGAGMPRQEEAIATLRAARAAGIDFFDTAPAYGEAERRVGLALLGDADAILATKILPPQALAAVDWASFVRASVDASLMRLGRSRLDLLNLHNATAATMECSGLLAALRAEVTAGRVVALGASVYGTEDAAAVIATPGFKSVQIAFSILDQRCRRVFDAAEAAGVGLIARSVLLKGALTPRVHHLPPALAPLVEAADRVRRLAACSWEDLPCVALRYVLSIGPPISVALTGARSQDELEGALRALAAGPLPPALMRKLDCCGLKSEALLNPARWPDR